MKKYLFLCVAVLGLSMCSPFKQKEPEKPVDSAVTVKPSSEQTPLRERNTLEMGHRPAANPQAGSFVPQAPGKRVSRVAVPGMYVALTFDDGPRAGSTAKALDILKRHGAKGTFFVLGENVVRNPSLVARAKAEGHEIGCHTWNHPKLSSLGVEGACSQISRSSDAIESAAGKRPVVMRPPYGATNKAIADTLYQRYGMATVLWDVDTLDWRHPGVDKVINTAVSQARPGSIILVHDIHDSTIAALEGIVVGLQARGFKLVTVSELMALGRRAASAPAPAAAPAAAPIPEPAAAPISAPAAAPISEPAAAPIPEPALQAATVTEEAAGELSAPQLHAVRSATSGAAAIGSPEAAPAEISGN